MMGVDFNFIVQQFDAMGALQIISCDSTPGRQVKCVQHKESTEEVHPKFLQMFAIDLEFYKEF